MKRFLLYILSFILISPLFATPEEDFIAALRDSRHQDALFFLDAGNSVDQPVERGTAALLIMCDEQRSREVRWLISHGADPNRTDPEGLTPLMHAARRGNRNILQILLQAGARVNTQSPEGYTALQLAVNNGRFDIAAELESRGAVIFNGYYDHPVLSEIWIRRQHYAAALALRESRWMYNDFLKTVMYGDYRQIRTMIDEGMSPDAATTEGVTALMLSASADDIFKSALLLEKGANPLQIDTMGLSALWYAAFRNNLPLIRLLLESGADNKADFIESSALFGAFASGAHEALTVLLDAGWDGAQTGRLGSSLVHYAAFTGDLRTLRELKKYGVSLTALDGEGRTALDYLIQGFQFSEAESVYIPAASFLKSENVGVSSDPSVLDNTRLSRIIYTNW
ncbi:MAG: ankyrin repeat domain-containing protein [Spirochaetales bacterium]|nr:ankyrin repeat domain-containing protein [Spirochaetales bacterium]